MIHPSDIMESRIKIAAIAVVAVIIIAGTGAFLLAGGDDDKGGIDITESGNYLKIFGNANGDHLLDDDDIDIIQGYIDGKIPESDLIKVADADGKEYYLADANTDGVVDAEDIEFFMGVIDRTNQYMYLFDSYNHLDAVPMNAKRIACDYFGDAELLMLVGAQSRIVATTHALIVLKDYYLQGAPSNIVDYKSRTTPDFEAVAEVDPEIWVTTSDYKAKYSPNTNAVVIGLSMLTFDLEDVMSSPCLTSVLLAGYIFDNVKKAMDYVNWYLDTWHMLYDKTSGLGDEDRPDVFYTGYGNNVTNPSDQRLRYFPGNTGPYQAVVLAGGHNIIDDYPGGVAPAPSPTGGVYIDLEWISEQKYDCLFAHCTRYTGTGGISASVPDHGYICDDPSFLKEGQAALGNVKVLGYGCNAENMYCTPGDYMNGASGGLLTAVLVASCIHPDLFPDLSLQEEHQKYIDMLGFDYDLSKHGVFFVTND